MTSINPMVQSGEITTQPQRVHIKQEKGIVPTIQAPLGKSSKTSISRSTNQDDNPDEPSDSESSTSSSSSSSESEKRKKSH